MEFAQYFFIKFPDDITMLISDYEPNTRTHEIKRIPTHLTVWNKHAVRREIVYGTIFERFKITKIK